MAQYTAIFTKPYEDGYENLPSQNTPITAETLNDKDDAIEHIEDFLDGQEFPTVEEKAIWDSAQNLYQYTLLDQVAQINSNTQGIVSPIALNDYSVGDLFIQQKKLCKAITPIANGDELIKNTNYIEVNVGDELGLKANKTVITANENDGYLKKNLCKYILNAYPNTDAGKFVSGSNTTAIFYGIADMIVTASASSTNRNQLAFFGQTKPDVNVNYVSINSLSSYTTTLPETGWYAWYINNAIVNNVQVEQGSTATNFTPYAPSNIELDNKKADITAIGTDESGNDTASKAYSQGDYFYKNGIAKAKTSIAQGATFTLNTNYEIKTLAEILQAIESAL